MFRPVVLLGSVTLMIPSIVGDQGLEWICADRVPGSPDRQRYKIQGWKGTRECIEMTLALFLPVPQFQDRWADRRQAVLNRYKQVQDSLIVLRRDMRLEGGSIEWSRYKVDIQND